ncbi:MAG TPA: MFS transporter [Micromonosporaceae bacterium]
MHVLTAAPSRPDVARIQRRTLAVLLCTQVIGGVGVAIGVSVGALLAASMGGTRISGFGQSALLVGAAMLAVPVTRLMRTRGRRPGLALAYLVGATGAALVVFGAGRHSLLLLFAGLIMFGGGSTANLQARYAAVDLADPARRGRQLSFVVWATTIGAVAGPNLVPLADRAVHRFGAVTYAGPFVFSAVAFLTGAVLVTVLLRPDPLLVARRVAAAPPDRVETGPGIAARAALVDEGTVVPVEAGRRSSGVVAAMREVAARPAARLGIASVAVGHLVMVGVMSMTPVHIGEGGHPDTLRIVGLVLSLHIAGMYALSPVTGWLTDRIGRRPVILLGIMVLLLACAVAGTAGHDTVRLSIGLSLLGLGWSGTMVAGSTLLSESVGVANKPAVQGLSDLIMGLAGGSAGALSGLVVAWSSYATLTALAAVATVPLIALALRPVGTMVVGEAARP